MPSKTFKIGSPNEQLQLLTPCGYFARIRARLPAGGGRHLQRLGVQHPQPGERDQHSDGDRGQTADALRLVIAEGMKPTLLAITLGALGAYALGGVPT
jgi:hypothetical protein